VVAVSLFVGPEQNGSVGLFAHHGLAQPDVLRGHNEAARLIHMEIYQLKNSLYAVTADLRTQSIPLGYAGLRQRTKREQCEGCPSEAKAAP